MSRFNSLDKSRPLRTGQALTLPLLTAARSQHG
jgi:hypothetical protein